MATKPPTSFVGMYRPSPKDSFMTLGMTHGFLFGSVPNSQIGISSVHTRGRLPAANHRNRAEATGSSSFSINGEVVELKLPVTWSKITCKAEAAANKVPKVYKNPRIKSREEQHNNLFFLSFQEHAHISLYIYI